MGSHNRQSIGFCVYCGRHSSETFLTDEHVVAKGLGGLPDERGNSVTLLGASCPDCAVVVNRFETACIDNLFKGFRVATGTRSNRKRGKGKKENRALTETIWTNRDGTDLEIEIGTDDHPGIVYLPLFEPPRMLSRVIAPAREFKIVAHDLIEVVPDAARRYLNLNRHVRMTMRIIYGDLFRMLAKIAHCYAIERKGYGAFQPLLKDLILGNTDGGGAHYVGCTVGHRSVTRRLHTCYYFEQEHDGERLACVYVRLPAKWGGPAYTVIVGTVPKEPSLA